METDAVIFESPGKVVAGRATVPDQLGPQELLIRTHYTFVSPGTERWILLDKFRAKDGPLPPPFPRVPGYQRVGEVLDVGSEVKDVKPGQIVFSALARTEKPVWMWGSHISVGVSPAEFVLPLPEGMSEEEVAALVIVQVGYNAGTRPPVKLGDVAVVVGDGLIGQFAAQTLRARGAYVIQSGLMDERLEMARGLSADETVNPQRTDLVKHLRKLQSRGADIVVESVGLRGNIPQCIEMLSQNGHYVSLGYYPQENPFDLMKVHGLETTIYNPSSFTRERLQGALRALQLGKLHVRELITHRLPWRKAPEAFRMVVDGKPHSLGIVLDWREGKA